MKCILELEMPKDCLRCPVADLVGFATGGEIYCNVLKEGESECPVEGRRDDCPLKEAK